MSGTTSSHLALSDSAHRPWEVTLLVVLGYISGVFGILTGVLVMLDRQDVTLQDVSLNTEGQLISFGLMVAVVGIAQVLLANWLGKGSQLIRVFYAVVAVFNLAGGIWAMTALTSEQRASGTVTAAMAIVVLWLLFNGRSDEFFRRT